MYVYRLWSAVEKANTKRVYCAFIANCSLKVYTLIIFKDNKEHVLFENQLMDSFLRAKVFKVLVHICFIVGSSYRLFDSQAEDSVVIQSDFLELLAKLAVFGAVIKE